MSSQAGLVSQDDLHAFVDGALDPAARARVEAYLKANPEDAARVQDYALQNEALRLLGSDLDRSAGGTAFRVRRPSLAGRTVRALPWAAAAAALLALGLFGGWWARGVSGRDASTGDLNRLAAAAYRLYSAQQRHPVEVWANERDHLQAWLGKTLNGPFVAPELAPQGYQLVGGRLLSNTAGAAALLLYERKDAERIALYVTSSTAAQKRPRFEAEGNVGTLTWRQGTFWYSLAGHLSDSELRSMADSVNRQVGDARGPATGTPLARR